MTTWVATAWAKMCHEFDFRRLFEKTGCLMSVQGCNAHFTRAAEYKFVPPKMPSESLEDDASGDEGEVENDEEGQSDDDEVCDYGGDLFSLIAPISAGSPTTRRRLFMPEWLREKLGWPINSISWVGKWVK